jgi:hypothetical protein
MLLVVTPGLHVNFRSATFWEGSASIMKTSTNSDLDS